jgi:1-acyl-sn-glycerol-3-phosphate acyltransferase
MNLWRRRGVSLRGDGDPALYAALRLFCALFIAPLHRYSARGGEHVPPTGGIILSVSHKSWWDPIFAGMALRRPVRPMAKIELFRHPVSRWVVSKLGAFPVRRGEGDVEALRTSLAVVAQGEVLLMFPEGTRHHDDRIHPFFAGIGLLASRSQAPVVPVAIRGTKQMARNGLPRFPRVRVAIGPPVDLSGLEGRGSERHAAAAERVRAAVAGLYDSL